MGNLFVVDVFGLGELQLTRNRTYATFRFQLS
jgi:hypothetical protein